MILSSYGWSPPLHKGLAHSFGNGSWESLDDKLEALLRIECMVPSVCFSAYSPGLLSKQQDYRQDP